MAADFRDLMCERLSFRTPSGPPWHPDGSRGETGLLYPRGGAWRSSGGPLGPASVNARAAQDVGAGIRRGLR